MSVPGHRPDCQTRTFKTRCPDCNKEVWYFDCTCGSKIFFDALGDPWPKHMDTCSIYFVKQLLDEGSTASNILYNLEKEAERLNVDLDHIAIAYLKKLGSGGKIRKRDVPPSLTPLDFGGILKSVNKVNFYKRLNLDRNVIIDATLGEFATEAFYEFTVEEEIKPNRTYVNKWTFVVPESNLQGFFPKTGVHVFGTLIGKLLFDNELIWCCEDLDWK